RIDASAASNTIGGASAGAGNVVSGNSGSGVQLASNAAGNVVQGNFIGTNAAGTGALGNSQYGIYLNSASVNSVLTNTISGNTSDGINVSGNGALAGTVSWWKAEGAANDSVDGNGGTPQGGTTFTAGKFGQAFTFSSNSDGVVVPNNANLNVQSSGFTAEFWVKGIKNQPDPGLATVLEKSHGATDATGWAFQIFSGTGVMSFAMGNGGAFPQINGSTDVLDGNWHHIAGTWDSGGTMRLYVDGTLQGTAANAAPANNTRA